MKNKLCVFCEHWEFDKGHPAYSDVTPGEEYDEYCRKGHWNVKSFHDEDDYRKIIRVAETCSDFKHVDGS